MGNNTSLPDAPDAPGPPTSPLAGPNRPNLSHRPSSSTTIKGGKRRKSIELPDLDPSLAFTATSIRSETPDVPAAVKWGRKSARSVSSPKSSVGRSTAKAVATVSIAPISVPSGTSNSDPKANQEQDANTPVAIPPLLEESSPLPSQTQETSSLNVSRTDLDLSATMTPLRLDDSNLPVLQPPEETIVAPLIPESVVPLPIGPGATPSTSLVVGSMQHLFPALSPLSTSSEHSLSSQNHVSNDKQSEHPAQAALIENRADKNAIVPEALPASVFPLSPELISDPSQAPPVPAAAPLAALSNLSDDPAGQMALKNAIVDLGGGQDAVPTLLTWAPTNESGGADSAPKSVYVTGTFAKAWKAKVQLQQKKSAKNFSALVALPPGPHRLKFIVDKQWKTSKNLPSATDQDGNLINYLQVSKAPTAIPTGVGLPRTITEDDMFGSMMQDDEDWTTEIPEPLVIYGEAADAIADAEDAAAALAESQAQSGEKVKPSAPIPSLPPFVQPPALPAQLQHGVLNQATLVSPGSGDDNSILPKPDHSVIDHLAASPISKGLLSVGLTKRYKRKFATWVYYKPVPPAIL